MTHFAYRRGAVVVLSGRLLHTRDLKGAFREATQNCYLYERGQRPRLVTEVSDGASPGWGFGQA
jgi:hypothetical protein